MGLNGYDYTQQVNSDQGIRTQYGIILPPGARVAAYVRSTGIQSGDDTFLAQNLVTTLAAGLARCRPGFGDFVVCLPGHVENVADATTFSNALVAGAKIIGVGRGSNTPTFTWTTAASQWLINKADVAIMGLKLVLAVAGTNTTLAINITAADFGFNFNDVVTGSASSNALVWIWVSVGGDRADLSFNSIRSLNTGTNGIVVGAAADGVRICDNEIIAGNSAAVGSITVTAAATNLRILRNVLYNTSTASTVCVSFGAFASDGILANNVFGVLNNGTASAQGVTFGAGCLVKAFQNFCSDEPQKSGLLSPVAAT